MHWRKVYNVWNSTLCIHKYVCIVLHAARKMVISNSWVWTEAIKNGCLVYKMCQCKCMFVVVRCLLIVQWKGSVSFNGRKTWQWTIYRNKATQKFALIKVFSFFLFLCSVVVSLFASCFWCYVVDIIQTKIDKNVVALHQNDGWNVNIRVFFGHSKGLCTTLFSHTKREFLFHFSCFVLSGIVLQLC